MIRSLQEKELLKKITKPSDALPFKMTEWNTPEFGTELYYNIPAEKKEEVLKKLWPFAEVPSFGTEFIDIHEDKRFKIEDFIVVRFDGYDMIASPYYFSKGGTVLDFMPIDSEAVFAQVLK